MNKLPEFKPLPDVDNLSSNYMSAFNHGMNIYEALVYLQGYLQITYNSMDDLLDDWNNFEQYVTENISKIANEKTQEILNQWLSDGTLNELIAKNPLWNQKVSKSGDIMSGNLQFQENKGVYGTLHSGDRVNIISHSYTGSDDYTQIGDSESQAVVRSKKRPVWYDGNKNQDLIVEDDLNDINTNITNLQENAERGVYWNENGSYDTLQDYDGNNQTKILKPSDIIDNLTSSSTDKALSANQGKVLNTKINGISKHFLIDGNIGLYTSGKATLRHQSNSILSANVTMPTSINNSDYLCLMTIHNVNGSAMYIGNSMNYEISGNNLKLEFVSNGSFTSGHVVEVAYFVFKRTV